MIINVAIEPWEPDCRAKQVMIEAGDELAAANKVIEIAKSMCDYYEYITTKDEDRIYIQAINHDRDDEYGSWPETIAIIRLQTPSSMDEIKNALRRTCMF